MTNSELLQDAMGQIDNQYLAEVLEYHPAGGGTRRRARRLLTAAACLCLAAGIGIGAMQMRGRTDVPSGSLPSDVDEILWAGGASEGMETTGKDSMMALTVWKDWQMSSSLWQALNEADRGTYVAVLVRRDYNYTAQMNFVYGGKTNAEWNVERVLLEMQILKLGQFKQEGQWLKYGEALYTTGTPEGERWSQELYEQRVEHYGAHFIEQYVQDSELLTEKIESELAVCGARLKEVDRTITALLAAYHAQNAQEDFPIFVQAGAHCVLRNGELYLFVTKSELAKLDIPNRSDYMLTLAAKNDFLAHEEE